MMLRANSSMFCGVARAGAAMAVAAIIGSACADTAGPLADSVDRARIGGSVAPSVASNVGADAKFLPYGVPIPMDQVITREPEPYQLAKHGPPHSNPIPQGPPIFAPREAYRRSVSPGAPELAGSGPKTDPSPQQGGSGEAAVNIANWNRGIRGYNDVQHNVSVPLSSWLYAPTNLPSDSSCIEQSTIHRRVSFFGVTEHGFGLWNWCDQQQRQQVEVFEPFTSTWKAAYARLYTHVDGGPAEEVYYAWVEGDSSNCWHGYLYNFSTGYYDRKTPVAGWCGQNYLATSVGVCGNSRPAQRLA